MRYDNLHHLINSSSSSRKYFLSLPVTMQMSLHEHGENIHSAEELHRKADIIGKYERHCNVSDMKLW